jgi:predicted CXXCH cytochrome family protein
VKLLVIHRTGPRGAPAKKTVQADWVRVGRNASCEVYLPDPRIALEQGLIVDRDGLVYIEGEGAGSGKSTTRRAVSSVRLQEGEPIEVGPYRLERVAAPPGYDGAISVELVRQAEITKDLASRTSARTLASLSLSKRWASWILGGAVLVLFLAIPAARVLDLPWKSLTKTSAVGDRFWNPGPLSLAHQPIEAKCEACHEVAFQHVRDTACLECHAKIGQHVAQAFHPAALFEGARCTSCHREHKGIKSTHRDDDGFCVDCHREIRTRATNSDSRDVRDFAKDHPPFRVTLPVEGTLRRVRQGEGPLVESTNLAFPHDKHLDPRGVKSPEKGRVKLDCKNCHVPDASKRSFEPISMVKHCQECHALKFEPAVTTREVPHGKPAEALTVIEEFYANLALKGTPDSFQKAFGVPGEGLLRRVGEPSAGERQQALSFATRKANKVAVELFEVRVCKTCHVGIARTETSAGAEWKIAPVRASHRWMPRAEFDHKAHAQSPCGDCHDSARSKKASDVSMPAIAKCRECHGGSKPVQGRITSNCLLCHGFHDPRFPWNPDFKPRGQPQKEQGRVAER